MRDLSELIASVEKLTGEDQRLSTYANCDIHALLVAKIPKGYTRGSSSGPYLMAHGRGGKTWRESVPNYLGSHDAAVALKDQVLPGWEWQAGDDAILGRYAAVYRSSSVGGAGFCEEDIVAAATTAIALVLATLKALAGQIVEEANNG